MKFKKKHLRTAAAVAVSVMLMSCGDMADDEAVKAEQAVDSLFTTLMERMELAVQNDVDYNATAALDFESLANDFSNYVADGDMKANVGYIVAEMMSLNKSESLIKLADSLDSYFSSTTYDEVTVVEPAGRSAGNAPKVNRRERIRGIASQLFSPVAKNDFVANAYKKEGVNGMSAALLSRAPEIALSRSETPSWPSFITISYIQDIVDTEITPRLGRVIEALERIEQKSSNESLIVSIEQETFEIDVADIYMLEASVRALRSTLNMVTAYNLDVYAPGTSDYSWIDDFTLDNVYSSSDNYTVSLVNDTLYNTYDYTQDVNTENLEYTFDLFKYNMERSDFCTIRKENHAIAYADLLEVPKKIDAALVALEQETDSQEDDVIKQIDLQNLDADLVNVQAMLEEEGFSADFAENFASPRKMVAFIESILSGPYKFNQTLNVYDELGEVTGQATVDLTVDISKFYTNPIEDLRDLLPLHQMRTKENCIETKYFDYYENMYSSNIITKEMGVTYDIPESKIESIDVDPYWGDTIITLKEPYVTNIYRDKIKTVVTYDLVDGNGAVMSSEDVETMLFDNGEIPYFDDYTINGIFPDMTRDKWNSLIEELGRLL